MPQQILRFPFSKAQKHDSKPWLWAFTMPVTATITSLVMLPDGPALYAVCDPTEEAAVRYIATPATGADLPDDFDLAQPGFKFIGTIVYAAGSQPGRVNVSHAIEVPHRYSFITG